jgi:hypothetical protein
MLMGKPTANKSITFTAVTIMMMIIITILTLTLPDTTLNVSSQTRDVSEFELNKSKVLDFQSPNTNSTVKNEKTLGEGEEEITMKVQLVPHENNYLKDWYQVSNFSFVTSNTSKICQSSSSDLCEYQLENGKMTEEFNPGERSLTGKFIVDTAMSSNDLMNLSSIWKAVEELEEDGETIQVIKGTLSLNKDTFQPEHKYQINGTLSKNNDTYYFLEVKGKK